MKAGQVNVWCRAPSPAEKSRAQEETAVVATERALRAVNMR